MNTNKDANLISLYREEVITQQLDQIAIQEQDIEMLKEQVSLVTVDNCHS